MPTIDTKPFDFDTIKRQLFVDEKGRLTVRGRDFLQDLWRRTGGIINGLISNQNVSEDGTTITIKSGATFNIAGTFQLGGIEVTANANELNFNDGAAPGIAIANKTSVSGDFGDTQQVSVRGYSNIPANWKGGGAFGYTSSTVIMGELGGVATLGGHSSTLNAWANLSINSGGGNVSIGSSTFNNKLSVSGNISIGTTTAAPTNGALIEGVVQLNNLTASELVGTTASKELVSILDGDGIEFSGTTLSADINTTNLQFTANEINTIQDIASTSDVIFKSLTLNNGVLDALTITGNVEVTGGVTATSFTGAWSGGVISVDKGGTGQTTYIDGELLIGNSVGNTLTKTTLTEGGNISITNGNGSITISTTGHASSTAEYVVLSSDGSLTNERILTAGEGIDLADAGAGSTITVSGEDASTSNKGIASFSNSYFDVISGQVSILPDIQLSSLALSDFGNVALSIQGGVEVFSGTTEQQFITFASKQSFQTSSGTVYGFDITVGSSDIIVTHLGYNAVELTSGTREVAIYDTSDQSQLATATINSTDTTENNFKYVELPSPLYLNSGTTVRFVALVPSGDEVYSLVNGESYGTGIGSSSANQTGFWLSSGSATMQYPTNAFGFPNTLDLLSGAGFKYRVFEKLMDLNDLTGDVSFPNIPENRLLKLETGSVLTEVSDLTDWIAGTSNQITVIDDGDGSVTLSTPQNINTTSDPTFNNLTLNGELEINSGSISDTSGISFFSGNPDYKISFDSAGGLRGFLRFNVDSALSTLHGFKFSSGDISGGSLNDTVYFRADGKNLFGLHTVLVDVPYSSLDSIGSFGTNIRTITSSTTITDTDSTLLVDAIGGAITVTLTSASTSERRIYNIKKIDSSSNTVTVDGSGSETIDGSLTQVITTQYDSITIQCDGTQWWII